MFKERDWFLYGFIIKRFVIGIMIFDNEGEHDSVEFNWEKGLSKFLIGWFHTHPKNVPLSPSSKDQKTMRSWVRTLEKPLLCGIMHDKKDKTNLLRVCYVFKRWPDKSVNYQPILKEKLLNNLFFGVLP